MVLDLKEHKNSVKALQITRLTYNSIHHKLYSIKPHFSLTSASIPNFTKICCKKWQMIPMTNVYQLSYLIEYET